MPASLTPRRRRVRNQRGFVLVSALVIAALYLGLIELTLMDAATRLRTAQRFRSRIMADILAQNGAELAAQNMVNVSSTTGTAELAEGELEGEFNRTGDSFVLRGRGKTSGVHSANARIEIVGRIDRQQIWIDGSKDIP